MKRFAIVLSLALILVLIFAGSAWAATYSVTPKIPGGTFAAGEWSHGNYNGAVGPDVCKDCHAVHQASPNSLFLLLNYSGGTINSISGICMVCHGNNTTLTNANPYMYLGTRVSPGGTQQVAYDAPTAAHFCDVTVSWGDYDGETATTRQLYCADCHQVHGNDVTAVFVISAAYDYNPLIGNRIGPSQSLLTSGDKTVTAAYADLCGVCHTKNDLEGQKGVTSRPTGAFVGTTTHPSYNTQTTMAYNMSSVGGAMTVGAQLVTTGYTVDNCNSCHKRMKLSQNPYLPSQYRINRTDAYALGGAFHGGVRSDGTVDQKLLSSSVTPSLDENCLYCHTWGSRGVGKTY